MLKIRSFLLLVCLFNTAVMKCFKQITSVYQLCVQNNSKLLCMRNEAFLMKKTYFLDNDLLSNHVYSVIFFKKLKNAAQTIITSCFFPRIGQ